MDEDLREAIIRIIERNVCEIGADGLENGEIIGADTAADEIMKLVKQEREDNYRSTVLDITTANNEKEHGT
jgi:hypothetical protein